MIHCRKNIKGCKVWNDGDNIYKTRPNTVTINLLRDGQFYRSTTIDSFGDGCYIFDCVPIWKNINVKYTYKIQEVTVPNYTCSINGNKIINTLDNVTINGTKVWQDNNNHEGLRPTTITVILLQNGIPVRELEITSPPDVENISEFSFNDLPIFDDLGNPFIYTIDEEAIEGYTKTIVGNNIINTLSSIFSFTFIKKNIATGLGLEGATFELRKMGALIANSTSNVAGEVTFSNLSIGNYQMRETVTPEGYIGDTTVHQIVVANNGTITINGQPANTFVANNSPLIDFTGVKVWIDQDNEYNTRSNNVTIKLLQNEVIFKQKMITTVNNETSFTFENLPEYKLDGTKYIYTLEEDGVPNGYVVTKPSNTRIENRLTQCKINVCYQDKDTKNNLDEEDIYAYYGSSLTINAKSFPGYTALEPTTYTFEYINKDERYVFEYKSN